MKKLLIFVLLLIPFVTFGQAEKRYRAIIVDSLKALNGGRLDAKDSLLLDSLAFYGSDLSSKYTSRSLVDSAFVGTAISGSGHDAVTLSGTPDYITLSGQDIIRGQIDLGTDITGTTTATSISDFDTEVSNNASVAANTAKVTNAGHTGDVTGSTALTIANKAVEVVMLDDGTDGELITWDASGVATTVSTGSSGEVLTSNGVGTAPTFQAGGGNTIYSSDDNLAGNRTVTQGANTLDFTATSIDAFSIDGTTFSIDANSNRVGIGTAAPVSIFNVEGGLTRLEGINASSTSDALLVEDNVGTDLFIIENGGDVGINTSDPSNLLTLNAEVGDGYVLRNISSQLIGQLARGSTGAVLELKDDPGSNVLVLFNSGSNSFIADGNRVGINTKTPESTFTVKELANNGRIELRATDNKLRFYIQSTTSVGGIFVLRNAADNADFIVFNGAGNNSFFDAGGNVGVGTSTFGTSAVDVLAIGQGTPPSTSPGDLAQIYVRDHNGAGTSTIHIRNEEGDIFVYHADGSYVDPTGTTDKGTFATSTVTTEDLAEFVKAMYETLKAQGLIKN